MNFIKKISFLLLILCALIQPAYGMNSSGSNTEICITYKELECYADSALEEVRTSMSPNMYEAWLMAQLVNQHLNTPHQFALHTALAINKPQLNSRELRAYSQSSSNVRNYYKWCAPQYYYQFLGCDFEKKLKLD